MESEEEYGDGQEGEEDFFEVDRQGEEEVAGGLSGIGDVGRLEQGGGGTFGLKDDAEEEDGEDRADGAEGDEAEAIAGGVFAVLGSDAESEGHDEGDGDGAGCDAAGVEGEWDKVWGRKCGEEEDDGVQDDEEASKRDSEAHAEGGEGEEESDAAGDGKDQGPARDSGGLAGEDLEVWFGHSGEETEEEIDQQRDQETFGAADGGADAFAHRDHRHIDAEGKEAHTDDEQGCAEEEEDQGARVEGSDRDGEEENDSGDWQDAGQGLLIFFSELFIDSQDDLSFRRGQGSGSIITDFMLGCQIENLGRVKMKFE